MSQSRAKTQRKAESNGTGNGAKPPPAIAADIDALGDHGQAMILAEMYVNVSEQLVRLDFTQKLNDADDDDILQGPNGPLTDASGAPLSYGRRREQLLESKRKTRDLGDSIWPTVEKVIAKQKQQRAQSIEG